MKLSRKIFVAGGTGLIGKRLVQALLSQGHQVTVLTRSASRAGATLGEGVRLLEGDVLSDGPWQAQVAQHDAVVNLVGEPIADHRWSDEQKQKIVDSRILSTRALVRAIKGSGGSVRVLVQGTAVGLYGEGGERELDESAPAAHDFLGKLCQDWEAAALEAEGVCRVVRVRTGIVLDLKGGALAKMKLAFQLYGGGPLGSGRQYFPWIHSEDLVGLILLSLEREELSGVINGVAPEAVTMSAFAETLGKVMRRPSLFPVPSVVLRLAMGERAEMLLASQRVVPRRAIELGYVFKYPNLERALTAIFLQK